MASTSASVGVGMLEGDDQYPIAGYSIAAKKW